MTDAAMPERPVAEGGPTPSPDLRSPNWVNTPWIANAAWSKDHVGEWVLVSGRSVRSRLLCAGTRQDVQRGWDRLPGPEQSRACLMQLSLDDDPTKRYIYLEPKSPVVYYALSESTGVIKIGTSTDVQLRLLTLAAGRAHGPWQLLAVEYGSYSIEKLRHDKFSDLWIAPVQKGDSRELYEPAPVLMDHIRDLLRMPRLGPYRPKINWLSTRLVLDKHVATPEFRPPIGARVPLPLLDASWDMAYKCNMTHDEFVEAALVAYLAGEDGPRARSIQDLLEAAAAYRRAEDEKRRLAVATRQAATRDAASELRTQKLCVQARQRKLREQLEALAVIAGDDLAGHLVKLREVVDDLA